MLSHIQSLFPQTILNPDNAHQLLATHYLFEVDDELIAIERKSISQKELALLELLIDKKTTAPAPSSHWQAYLQGHSPNVPIITKDIQFVHINFHTRAEQLDYTLWFNTFQEAIPNTIEWFSHNAKRFTIILAIQPYEESLIQQLQAIIQTLDADFDTVTQSIYGYVYSPSTQLVARYQEELDIVEKAFQHEELFTTQPLTPYILRQIGHLSLPQMPLLAPLQQTIAHNKEYQQLIQSLFAHQGNLTQTAEKLYIHRNTLAYRLQKFNKETGMQLQSLPDLIICYLCLP